MDFSPAALLASLAVSTVGLALFLYGKKQVRFPQLVVGLSMMVYPYFVAGALAIWCVGGGLGLALVVALRLGM